MIETYADLAQRVLAAPARLGATRLVAVDGPSGAGKGHFAERLAAAVTAAVTTAVTTATGGTGSTATPTPVVHTDDLLEGWDDQLTFWPRLVRWVLAPLRAGRTGRYRAYDWHAGRFGGRWHPVPPAPVVLLEGVTAARAEIRPELSLAVFVTAPAHTRLARVVGRDGEAVRPYLERWRAVEERHFAADATARAADLLVDGAPNVPHDPATEYVLIRAA